jgi:hypothetical protein
MRTALCQTVVGTIGEFACLGSIWRWAYPTQHACAISALSRAHAIT